MAKFFDVQRQNLNSRTISAFCLIVAPQRAALRQSILKKAFSGQLVPQDPTDEPAATLLQRIREERAKGLLTRKPVEKARSPVQVRHGR